MYGAPQNPIMSDLDSLKGHFEGPSRLSNYCACAPQRSVRFAPMVSNETRTILNEESRKLGYFNWEDVQFLARGNHHVAQKVLAVAMARVKREDLRKPVSFPPISFGTYQYKLPIPLIPMGTVEEIREATNLPALPAPDPLSELEKEFHEDRVPVGV
jgi:hypothetical protein